MTQVLRGNIIHAPKMGELSILEHGCLVLEDGVIQAVCSDLPRELEGAELRDYGELDPKNHTDLKHNEAKAATEDAEGNIEYWYCEGCGKYFSDKNGTKEIKKADIVTAKLKDDSKSPQAGDNSNLALWIALLFISGSAAIGTTVVSRKKMYNR